MAQKIVHSLYTYKTNFIQASAFTLHEQCGCLKSTGMKAKSLIFK